MTHTKPFFSATRLSLVAGVALVCCLSFGARAQARFFGGSTEVPDQDVTATTTVPEPALLLLFGSGLFAVARYARKRTLKT